MRNSILKVTIFAIAFAFVEAAVVVYLRHLLGASQPQFNQSEVLLLLPGITFLEPQTAVKIIKNTAILNVERIREVATLVILASVAATAGKNLKQKIAYFFLAFGVWDIFYYVFLKLIINWPNALTDSDTFFLLPVPWVGPVFVPVIISFCMILLSLFYLTKSKKS
ncbi:MAG: hypothetical protein Q7S45_03760 [Candidatus Curtissbacteria bacterium]|nr:hypothetical protein [Candidatus Curtissbacteria bacterium]